LRLEDLPTVFLRDVRRKRGVLGLQVDAAARAAADLLVRPRERAHAHGQAARLASVPNL
jgi:hypothetical protein